MKAFLALYAPTIANSDDIATLCPNCPIHALDPHPIGSTLNSGSKVAIVVVPQSPPVFLKMKAFLSPHAPTIANSDDMATLHPNLLSPKF